MFKSVSCFFLRCDRCLTKIYCSKECLKQDLREKHKDACKEESDERKVKVKEERKVRKEAEKTRLDKKSAEMMDKFRDMDFKKATLEAVEQFTNAKKLKRK